MWMISYRYEFGDHIGLKSLKKPPSRRKRNDGRPRGRTKKEGVGGKRERGGVFLERNRSSFEFYLPHLFAYLTRGTSF